MNAIREYSCFAIMVLLTQWLSETPFGIMPLNQYWFWVMACCLMVLSHVRINVDLAYVRWCGSHVNCKFPFKITSGAKEWNCFAMWTMPSVREIYVSHTLCTIEVLSSNIFSYVLNGNAFQYLLECIYEDLYARTRFLILRQFWVNWL